jgi:catechol 2,3-dioxygenase-like lactoylglutathione lyase family enzyme
MKYKLSGHVNFPTSQWEAATKFYKEVLGLEEGNGSSSYSHFISNNHHIYFDNNTSVPGPIFEFLVPDLDEAKQELLAAGCTVMRWDGLGKSCYLRDPFGFTFNVFEDKDAFQE